MTHLQKLIEQEFNKVKKDSHSTRSNFNKSMEAEEVSNLKREIEALKEIYGEYLEQWMQYLARGLSAFKDSKDYDQYFLKLQEAHKELFAEYIGDMEDYRECVSLL